MKCEWVLSGPSAVNSVVFCGANVVSGGPLRFYERGLLAGQLIYFFAKWLISNALASLAELAKLACTPLDKCTLINAFTKKLTN